MFIPRPDARLFTLCFGHGPRSLLAVGGWIGSAEVWHDCFGRLPHWRCVGTDHRGSGATVHTGPVTSAAIADDLLAVADALKLEHCVLAAESSGAGPALEAVQRAPGRFDALVLVGAAWERPAPGAHDGFIDQLNAAYDATLDGFAARCTPEPGADDVRRWGRQILARASRADAVALLRAREGWVSQDRLDRVTLPVLLLHGERDQVVPVSSSERLASRLRDAELQVLPGLGHVPMMTAPDLVAHHIERRFG